MKLISQITGDGSSTLFNPEAGESYHSGFGAITESEHIFIKNGLDLFADFNSISIFEMGMGTGLNALLAALWAEKHQIKINYCTIEKYPPEKSLIESLNFAQKLGNGSLLFQSIHQVPWNTIHEISPFFLFEKYEADLTTWQIKEKTDLVFYDAFSPAAQPELWTQEIFEKIGNTMVNNGILVSYCVKGIVKQALRKAGFEVKVLPGPPGKRHMLKAIKKQSNLK